MKHYKRTSIFILSLLIANGALAEKSFLESLDSNKAIGGRTIHAAITAWAQKPSTYFSLGESHLEDATAIPVAYSLARLFTNNIKGKYTFCTETIDDFLKSAESIDLQLHSEKSFLLAGNSEHKTNFQDCRWSKKTNALTYSGFFHQHRFARAWPVDFGKSAIIDEPGQNILHQLPAGKGLFISQIELIYLQVLASRNLIMNAGTDVPAFRIRAENLRKNILDIKSKMQLLYGAEPDINNNKYGAYFDKTAFNEPLLMNDKSWFLITNRGVHKAAQQMTFLRKLLSFSDSDLQNFLNNLSRNQIFYTAGFYGPTPDGKRFTVNYGGLSNLDGEVELIEINSQYVIVMDLNQPEFACYQWASTKPDAPAQSIDCGTIFKSELN